MSQSQQSPKVRPPYPPEEGGGGEGGSGGCGGPPRDGLKSVNRGPTSNLVDFWLSPLGTVILAVIPHAVICCAILLSLRPPLSLGGCLSGSRRYDSDWRGIRDFLFVAG